LRKDIEKDFDQALVFDIFKESLPSGIAARSTGLFGIDRILQVGGFPVGRVTELFGMESTGKSTLALHAIAEANRRKKIGVYFDAESALDARYLRRLGIKEDYFIPVITDTGEAAFKIIKDKLIPTPEVGVVVIDSLAALIPTKEFEEDLTKDQYAAKARMMAKALRKLSKPLGRSNAALIIINQLIDNIGGFGKTTPGGKALRFYASIRLELVLDKNIAMQKTKEVGVQVTVRKNKVGVPWGECTQLLRLGEGFDPIYDLYNEALWLGIVEKRSSWLIWGERKFQGVTNIYKELRENDETRRQLRKEVRRKWKEWKET